jgi:hypothetical protein
MRIAIAVNTHWRSSMGGNFMLQPVCSCEERDVVRRQAHHFVDLVSIWPDHNAPSIGPYTVEDDRRGLCRPVSPTGGGATQRAEREV